MFVTNGGREVEGQVAEHDFAQVRNRGGDDDDDGDDGDVDEDEDDHDHAHNGYYDHDMGS